MTRFRPSGWANGETNTWAEKCRASPGDREQFKFGACETPVTERSNRKLNAEKVDLGHY